MKYAKSYHQDGQNNGIMNTLYHMLMEMVNGLVMMILKVLKKKYYFENFNKTNICVNQRLFI